MSSVRTPQGTYLERDDTCIADITLDATVKISSQSIHGSGFFISQNVVATAKHVVDHGGQHFFIKTRTGRQCEPSALVMHETLDIALFRVTGCEDIAPLVWRSEDVKEGMTVYAAGHPLWSSWSFTKGIVSDADEGGKLQLDAVAEMGMSGGPVVDTKARFVGMSVSIVADPVGHTWGGETFAVKADDIIKFLLQSGI